jgi:hypothetical protein
MGETTEVNRVLEFRKIDADTRRATMDGSGRAMQPDRSSVAAVTLRSDAAVVVVARFRNASRQPGCGKQEQSWSC